MSRCRESAVAEPLAGTAPAARWWWLIEVPGPWGRRAIEDCHVPVVRQLTSTPQRRVLLIRRPGRHPAADPRDPLKVWICGALPQDPPPRLAVVDQHADLLDWPASGPDSDAARPDPRAPLLAICTNSSRDLCCGLDGRALVGALHSGAAEHGDRVWECSHLGGHRFAPTALLVGDGLVYGRLDAAAALSLIACGPTPATAAYLRGRSALAPAAQAAEVSLLAQGASPDPRTATCETVGERTRVTFAGVPAVWLTETSGEPRPASCGGEPEPWSSWRVVDPG